MTLSIYQVDAFTDHLFGGNPAAVIPLKSMLEEDLMQKIAMENNLAETAFICPSKNEEADYDIRWFTPAVEIDLCGHATLGAAFVLYNILNFEKPKIAFHSKSGILKVSKEDSIIQLDFPSWKPERFQDYPPELQTALGGVEIVGVYKYRDLLVELMDEKSVMTCNPDFTLIKNTGYKVIITAAGNKVDFVSRFFAPSVGINEDPATGSAHSQLIPFWSEKLGKNKMTAMQLSQRGASFQCEQLGSRVKLGGSCVFYMKGEISLS